MKSADIKYAKDEYKDVELSGKVKSKFLYATLRGSEIVPFSHLPFKIVVLPAEVKEERFGILDEEEAMMRGYRGLAKWVKQAEEVWRERGGKGRIKSAIERLNYGNELAGQNPSAKYKVLFLTYGKDIAACMLNLEENLEVKVNHDEMQLTGFVADTKTYHYETNDRNEALYLTSFLNSSAVNDLIKNIQSQGLFGPRHIHKKILEFPIPGYDSNNELHQRLADLAKECIKRTDKKLPKLTERYRSIAWIRKGIREELSSELERISNITSEILRRPPSQEALI